MKGKNVSLVILVLTLAIPLFFNASVFACQNRQLYSITDLGTLPGGNRAGATAINDNGQVVGSGTTANHQGHAFLWTKQKGMQDLGILPEVETSAAAGIKMSAASDINNQGEIVGISGISLEDGSWAEGWPHAVMWTAKEGIQDLGTLPGGKWSFAQSINDKKQVVGYSETSDGHIHAFIWSAKLGMKDLGTLGTDSLDSIAFGINNKGTIVGTSRFRDPAGDLFTKLCSWTTTGTVTELGLPPNRISVVYCSISSDGQIAGTANGEDSSGLIQHYIFTWDRKSGFSNLDGLPEAKSNYAYSINSKGEIVGSSQSYLYSNDRRPFLWTQKGEMQELPTLSDLYDTVARDINERGQIVGYSGGHAVIWKMGC
jgi:probable HAF family extracellular repeat protein